MNHGNFGKLKKAGKRYVEFEVIWGYPSTNIEYMGRYFGLVLSGVFILEIDICGVSGDKW